MADGTSKSKRTPFKCPERKRLGGAIMAAIEKTYKTKAEMTSARATKRREDLAGMLSTAAGIEGKAELDLCGHIEKHGCRE
jgi:hypothetical protein